METGFFKLTVLFDEPFWIGLFERERDGRYEACKVTFGAEPKDHEVYQFILDHYSRLAFSPALPAETDQERSLSPKRMQRLISRQVAGAGIGTKAQQALKLQREQGGQERKVRSREKRETEQERKFQLRQEKRKEKHRGH